MQRIKNHYFKNWAESYFCYPAAYFEPTTEEELRQILTEANETGKKVRIIGAGLSPSDLCCTDGFMICMKNFNKVLQIDKSKHTVLVEGGIEIEALVEILKKEGLALNMMPCIKNLSLAGMISTGSHNTGIDYPITSAYVLHMDIMKADGSVVSCRVDDQDTDLFYSAGCGLGALGIILRLTVQCAPYYYLHLTSESMPFEAVVTDFKKIASSSDHTRMFYIPYHDKITVQKMNRIKPTKVDHSHNWFWNDFIGFFLLQFFYFISLTYQPLVKLINRFYQRLFYNDSFKIIDSYENVFTFDVKFRQYVSEWSIPLENTDRALARLKEMVENSNFPAHLPVEIRIVKGDKFFLSSAYGRDSTYINILAYRPYAREPPLHKRYFERYAEIMTELGGRPHLAKDHPFNREGMARVYPKFSKFCAVRKMMDPNKIFVNEYIERVIHTD